MLDVRVIETGHMSDRDRTAVRRLLEEAFDGGFSDDDWQHALGGWHAIVDQGDSIVAHAALVERRISVDFRELRAGYVEAVAVRADCRRTGLGTAVMARVNEIIRARFDLGALSTGEWDFFGRLGWERWRGPTYVRTSDGRLLRSEVEDDGVMVLRCAHSQDIDPASAITCDERAGDSW